MPRPDGLIVIATPMAGLREHAAGLPDGTPRCGCARASKKAAAAGPRDRPAPDAPGPCGVLSGPSFALEVARGQPTALVAASERRALAAPPCRPSQRQLRVYTSTDPWASRSGGAVKNVLAIATGMPTAWPGPERPRRADHARPGRDDAPGPGAGRARRDLHGPVGPGRPGAHRHRRPVAQPPVGLLLAAGQTLARSWPTWAMWPKACYTAAPCWQRARSAGRGHADHRAVVACWRAGWRRRRRCALMAREAAPRPERGGPSTTPRRVAVLPPGFEHRHRHRIAQVQAALAGAHRQAHALRGGKASRSGRAGRGFAAEHQPVARLPGHVAEAGGCRAW
jgi:glycerol-3-phosphate dehydrogenase (NAD(P)+)